MVRREIRLIVCDVLITSIVLIRPAQQFIPIATHASLASWTLHIVVIGRRGEKKVIGVANGIFTYVVYAVHGVTDVAGQRPGMMRVIKQTMDVFLRDTRLLH